MGHCCIRWSFNEEVSQDQRRNTPLGIATSSDGQVLIADYYTLKVFDSNGNFYMSVRPQYKTISYIYDVVISDVDDTIYLLVTPLMSPRISSPEKFEVQVFNETFDFQLRFPVGKGSGFNRLTVSGSKVFIVKEHEVVDLYHARNGSYVGSFGEGIIESAQEITASKDGRVMVLDSDQSCHLFNVDGLHLANFSVNIQGDRYYRIACHPVGEHVVVAGEERETHLLIVAIYTVNGDFERKIQLNQT